MDATAGSIRRRTGGPALSGEVARNENAGMVRARTAVSALILPIRIEPCIHPVIAVLRGTPSWRRGTRSSTHGGGPPSQP